MLRLLVIGCSTLGFWALLVPSASAQTSVVLYSFTNSPDGANPQASLTLSSNTLYGTTVYGGSSGYGTVFKVNMDGTGYSVLKNFTNSPDGAYPTGLTLLSNVLYGTTSEGGRWDWGTVFKVNMDGTGYTVLNNFTNSPDGASPANLTLSSNVFYGTTRQGGSSNKGTVFKINMDGTGYTVLKNFTNSPDGANPYAGLTLSSNALYGTTGNGGTFGNGTVFKINTDGTGYTVLKNFTNSPDGRAPLAGLTLSSNVLYGTTANGGSSDYGTVFKINTDGTGYAVLISLINSPTGTGPVAGLTLSSNVLYGTTGNVATLGYGTVFKVNTDGTGYTVLKYFTSSPDGAYPVASLTMSGSVLYGTTRQGGSSGYGTVFALSTLSSPTIIRQPQNQIVSISNAASFSVAALGVSPMNYQWCFSNQWYFSTFQTAGAYAQTLSGFVYGCIVTNGGVGYTTKPQVQFIGGGGAGAAGYAVVSNGMVTTINVTNAGSGYTSLPLVQIDPPNGLLVNQTNATMNLNAVTTNNVGNYFVVITNSYGSITSSVATLTIAASVTLGNLSQIYDGTAKSATAVTFPSGITVNLTYNGSANPPTNAGSYTVIGTVSDPNYVGGVTNTLVIGEATSTVALGNLLQTYDGTAKGVTVATTPSGLSVNITYNGSTNMPISAGSYTVIGTVNDVNYIGSATNTLIIGFSPQISSQTTNQIVVVGSNAVFSVSATGSLPEAYQWLFNSNSIAGATNITFTINNAQSTNAGNYQVIVTNSFGSVTSRVATLTIAYPPSISQQPTGQIVVAGSGANFYVTAGGTLPLCYQWRMVSGIQSNATAVPVVINGFVLSNTITSGGAGYLAVPAVQFFGGSGSGASGTAVVSNRMVTAINMGSAGSGYATPPTVQIAAPAAISLTGQTNSILALLVVANTNAGHYFVVVTNNYGSVTSSIASLMVILPGYNQISGNLLSSGQMSLSFVGFAGANYALDRSFSLSPANWIPQITNPADANGNLIFTNTPDATTNNFWRIRSVP